MEKLDFDFLKTITSKDGYYQLQSLWSKVGRDEDRFIKIMENARAERLSKKKIIPMF